MTLFYAIKCMILSPKHLKFNYQKSIFVSVAKLKNYDCLISFFIIIFIILSLDLVFLIKRLILLALKRLQNGPPYG
jgi:hypothetical protein